MGQTGTWRGMFEDGVMVATPSGMVIVWRLRDGSGQLVASRTGVAFEGDLPAMDWDKLQNLQATLDEAEQAHRDLHDGHHDQLSERYPDLDERHLASMDWVTGLSSPRSTSDPGIKVTAALEHLYQTFSGYARRPHPDECKHCASDAQHRALFESPLRELGAGILGRFAFQALTLWANADDYRRFLPRVFELSLNAPPQPGLDGWMMGSKLTHASWHQWPQNERQAIQAFVSAAWSAALSAAPERLDGIPSWTVESTLEFAANAELPLSPYLSVWEKSRHPNATIHLAGLVNDNVASWHKRGKILHPSLGAQAEAALRAWLVTPARRAHLESSRDRLAAHPLLERVEHAIQALDGMIGDGLGVGSGTTKSD